MRTPLQLLVFSLALVGALPLHAQVPGSVDPGFNPNASSIVGSTALQPDGKIVLSGSISAGGFTHLNLARINGDGTLDSAFTHDANLTVDCIVVQANGGTLLGGNFTAVDNVDRRSLARLGPDGTLDPGFNPDGGTRIRSMVEQTDGQIIVGGEFSSIGGVALSNLARLTPTGAVDPTFNPQANSTVYVTALQSDGKIVIGGLFTTVGGVTRNRIARLNADGSLDMAFNPNADFQILCAAIQADGKIVIGGVFDRVGDADHFHIARLNADGTVDAGFNQFVSDIIRSVVLQTDGKIILGGRFTSVGLAQPATRNGIARLNADGTVDASFNPNPFGEVYSVALQADGKILMGGDFQGVGTVPVSRNRIARLLNNAATQSLTVPDTTRVQWLRGGASPETQQVTFELSTDGGATWVPLGIGTRKTGGWELTGLNLPLGGQVRARARIPGSKSSGSSSLVETIDAYYIDLIPPTLTPVGIASSNAHPLYAKVGNTITVNFTANEPIQTSVVTIAGQAATVAKVSGNNWKATRLVDANTPEGLCAFSITATDLAGNLAAAVTATTDASTVTVDRTPPSLRVPESAIAEATSPAGATVHYSPATSTDPTASFTYSQNSGTVFPLQTTIVTVTATDPAGNSTVETFPVIVRDTTPPTITILGSNPAMVEAGTPYVDAGATAYDAALGDITAWIRTQSNVNYGAVGNYEVTYRVIDLAEHAVMVARTVNVVDTTAPVITHLPDPLTVTADVTNHAVLPDLTGQVTATDFVGVTGVTQDPVPGSVLGYGPHTITFTVEDAAHNTATGSMVLTVADGPALTGRYAGLLSLSQFGNGAAGRAQPGTNGRIEIPTPVRALMELKLTRGRFLTGYLRLADERRVWFPGTILPAATHAATLTLNDGSSLALEFDGSGHVAATLTGGLGVLHGDGALADPGASAGVPGTYTAILEAEGATAPGWLYVVVSGSGSMRLSGRLPDGSTINAGQGSLVDRHGDALLFLLGRKPAHPLLTGTAHFENLPASDFSGALAFNDGPCTANGARFTRTPSGLPPGAYPITLEGAGIDIASTVTLLPNNTASVLAPLTKFLPQAAAGKPATGIFYTTFTATPTATRPVVRGSGIFHQKLGIGAGQFPRNGAEGRIQLGLVP